MSEKIVKFLGQDIDIGLTISDVSLIQSPLRTPVRTGNLRDSFVLINGEIKNDAFYGEWVELGTTRFVGRYMIAKSIPEIAGKLQRRVVNQLDKIKLFDLPKRL